MEYDDYKEIARNVFKKIQLLYPYLNMEIVDDLPHLDLCMDIPVQEGLKFEISLNLQNMDELHISSGKLWMCWFPCSRQYNVDDFLDVVKGLIDGKYRILEIIKGGKVIKARLQKPVNGKWVTKSSGLATFRSPSFKRKKYNIVQNI